MTTETVDAAQDETPAKVAPVERSPFAEAALNMYKPYAEQVATIATRLASANNVAKLVHEIRETSETTDEKILAFRKFKEDVLEKLMAAELATDQYIRESGQVSVEPVDVDALTREHKELVDKAKKLRDAVASNESQEAVSDWPTLQGIPGSRTTGASDIKRPRFSEITVDGTDVFEMVPKDGTEVKQVSLTVLGNWINGQLKAANSDVRVDSTKLRDEMFTAAGTTDLASLNGKPFSMAFTVGPKTYSEIVFTPRVTGSQAA